MIRKMAFAAMFLAGQGTAMAASETCMRRGNVDQQATAAWKEMVRQAQPEFMKGIAGVWHAEIHAPMTGQTDSQYQIFQADGQWEYRSQVCANATFCSDFSGHGLFAGRMLDDSQYTLMLMVSDLNRDRQCSGGTGRVIDSKTLQDSMGTVWRKVR